MDTVKITSISSLVLLLLFFASVCTNNWYIYFMECQNVIVMIANIRVKFTFYILLYFGRRVYVTTLILLTYLSTDTAKINLVFVNNVKHVCTTT